MHTEVHVLAPALPGPLFLASTPQLPSNIPATAA